MKKSILLVLVGVAAAAALFAILRPRAAEWTTTSPQALEEFQLGLESAMRFHHEEAFEHFDRAIQLDRGFAVARLMAYRVAPYDMKEKLLAEIKQMTVESLRNHERFLIGYEIAHAEDNAELAEDLLNDFLDANPDSPWGLEKKAEMAWRRYDFETAEKYYGALLEAEPNWVTAENNLGYIAMSRGDFEAAEEHFRTYQYIAPDQANPHDSRGELLTLIGDYDGAWSEFDAALEIRPDFCATYRHQMTLAVFAGFEDRIPGVVERASRHCEEGMVRYLQCRAQLHADYEAGDYEVWVTERDDDCRDHVGGSIFLYRMALREGATELAEEYRQRIRKRQTEFVELGAEKHNPATGGRLYLEGSQLLAEGRLDEAIASFEEADRQLFYMGHSVGIGKLLNLVDLVAALELNGAGDAAKERLDELLAVNPQMQGMVDERKRELAFLFDGRT